MPVFIGHPGAMQVAVVVAGVALLTGRRLGSRQGVSTRHPADRQQGDRRADRTAAPGVRARDLDGYVVFATDVLGADVPRYVTDLAVTREQGQPIRSPWPETAAHSSES